MHDFAHSAIEITRLDFAYYSHPTACIDQVRGEIFFKKMSRYLLLLAPNRHEIATLFASLVFTLCLEETPASDLTFWDLVRYLSSPRLSETVCCYPPSVPSDHHRRQTATCSQVALRFFSERWVIGECKKEIEAPRVQAMHHESEEHSKCIISGRQAISASKNNGRIPGFDSRIEQSVFQKYWSFSMTWSVLHRLAISFAKILMLKFLPV